MPPLLNVQSLKVHFPVHAGFLRRKVDEIKAVDDVSFEIQEGKTLGVLQCTSVLRRVENVCTDIANCGTFADHKKAVQMGWRAGLQDVVRQCNYKEILQFMNEYESSYAAVKAWDFGGDGQWLRSSKVNISARIRSATISNAFHCSVY